MRALRIIFTVVSKNQSPRKINGYQAVFYDVNEFTNNDIYNIETKINSKSNNIPNFEKETFFFEKIKEETFFVIVDIKDLPEERDESNRPGIYICQAFLFSSSIWKKTHSPITLRHIIKEKLFLNRSELFASTEIDQNSGSIKPIEITDSQIHAINKEYALESEFERKAVLLLNKLSLIEVSKRPRIAFRGSVESVSGFFEKLLFFVPDVHKMSLGIDTWFNGTLGGFPLRMIGHQGRNLDNDIIQIDLRDMKFVNTVPSELSEPVIPFEFWLYSLRDTHEPISKSKIENIYKFSNSLEGIEEKFSLSEIPESFYEANNEWLIRKFINECSKIITTDLAVKLAHFLNIKKITELILQKYPVKELYSILEHFILEKKYMPSKGVKINTAVISPNRILTVIFKSWNTQKLNLEDIQDLMEQGRKDVLDYLLITFGIDAFVKLLRGKREIFSKFIKLYEGKYNIGLMLVENYNCKKEQLEQLGFQENEIKNLLPANQNEMQESIMDKISRWFK